MILIKREGTREHLSGYTDKFLLPLSLDLPLNWISRLPGAASVLNGILGVFCVVCRGSQGSGPQGISGVTLRTTKGLGMALALCARLLIERLHGMVTAETMRQGTHCCRFPWGDDDMQSNPSPSSFIIFLYNSFSEHQ